MDMNKAGITRVHDALLGGTDHFPVDRAVRDRMVAVDPDFPIAARDVRAFLVRAVRYLIRDAGMTQFLDCGVRLPIAENSHTWGHQIAPDTTVVYASVDPLVVSRARAALSPSDHTFVTEVNISHANRVLTDPVVRKNLDFSRPMGLLHALTLQHIPDHDDPWLTMQQYVDALAPGSYVLLVHMLDPGTGHPLAGTIARLGEVYRATLGTGWARSAERILDLLPGLDLVEPGLVPVGDWRPETPRPARLGAMQQLLVCAVARKP
jgi:hypothetical protein